MIRLLVILLLNSLNFNKEDKHQQVDLRKKEPQKKFHLLNSQQIHNILNNPQVNNILLSIGILALLVLFIEFVFLCQGTESGMVRNNLNNI